jgi:hypothetical protein
MKLTIDTEAVIKEAMSHMMDTSDVRWSIGMALQELYPDVILKVQMQMVEKFMESTCGTVQED